MKKWLTGITMIALCILLTACSGKDKAVLQYINSSDTQTSSFGTSETDASSEANSTYTEPEVSTKDSGITSNVTSKSTSSNKSSTAASSKSSSSKPPDLRPSVTVLIPEGYTLSQIGGTLENKGVCKKADFLATANAYNFNYYSLVSKIPSDMNRCYKLEGYLFPNTYQFYRIFQPKNREKPLCHLCKMA
jgi:UPF0755 protein